MGGRNAVERREFLSAGIASGTMLAVLVGTSMPTAAAATDLSHFKIDGSLLLQAYRSLVEEHFAGVLRGIRALAVTGDAQKGDWASARPALMRLRGDLATAATIWFAQPGGSYATTDIGPTDKNLKDRAYFPKVLAGQDIVGDFVVSKSTGERAIIIATPVSKQGQVIAVIGVSLSARSISQMVIDRVGMPGSLTFYALDSHGQTAIHKDPKEMFEYPSDMGDPSLKSAIEIILFQPKGMVSYRYSGTNRKAIFDTSELTGWHFVLVQLAK